ncbi:MAG: polyprenyl synthetase family protein [Anaerolineales bacterium]|nr:polyprenyl synthetase family protein [Anaerolineales bacterium]MCA9885517.1 polyprenyl synthetase family protein [Anaerolineae bacterium]
MIKAIREAAMQHINLEDMAKYWNNATEKERPDWMLPLKVAQAIEPTYTPDANAAAVMASIGCSQISIILVDDMLDNEPDGAFREMGTGQAANMALAFQSLAVHMLSHLSLPPQTVEHIIGALSFMNLQTAVGQHLDVTTTEWTEVSYWQVVQAKSCPFYAWTFAIGAYLAGHPEYAQLFRQIGDLLGEIVQIRDDLFDIMAETPAPDWLTGGNLLLVYARSNEDRRQLSRFERLVTDIRRTGNLERAQMQLINDGAVEYCSHLLREKAEVAMKLLETSGIKNHQPISLLLDGLVNNVAAML